MNSRFPDFKRYFPNCNVAQTSEPALDNFSAGTKSRQLSGERAPQPDDFDRLFGNSISQSAPIDFPIDEFERLFGVASSVPAESEQLGIEVESIVAADSGFDRVSGQTSLLPDPIEFSNNWPLTPLAWTADSAICDSWRVEGQSDLAGGTSSGLVFSQNATSASARGGLVLLCLCAAAYLCASCTFWVWWSNQIRERALVRTSRRIHNLDSSAPTEVTNEPRPISRSTQVMSIIDSAEEGVPESSFSQSEPKTHFITRPTRHIRMKRFEAPKPLSSPDEQLLLSPPPEISDLRTSSPPRSDDYLRSVTGATGPVAKPPKKAGLLKRAVRSLFSND